jgi:hypothetical protein
MTHGLRPSGLRVGLQVVRVGLALSIGEVLSMGVRESDGCGVDKGGGERERVDRS